MAFSGSKEGQTSQHSSAVVSLRRPNIRREFFLRSALNFEDIPYNGDFCETLDRVHVKYVLPKVEFMPKTVANFVQKWAYLFISVVQDTNVTVGLTLLTTRKNVTTVLCAQGKKLNLV